MGPNHEMKGRCQLELAGSSKKALAKAPAGEGLATKESMSIVNNIVNNYIYLKKEAQ